MVAIHSVQHPMICRRVPTLSTSENKKRENPRPFTAKYHPRTTLGTHHCRLHRQITDITGIRCDNGDRQPLHQVCNCRSSHQRNLLHGNHQAFPRQCMETVWNPPEGDQRPRTSVHCPVHEGSPLAGRNKNEHLNGIPPSDGRSN